ESKNGNTRGGANLERLRPETGNVKPQIVVLPGHLDGNRAAFLAGQLAAAAEALVGALKCLDSEYGAAFDEDSLTDLQARSGCCDAKAELNVSPLLFGEGRT